MKNIINILKLISLEIFKRIIMGIISEISISKIKKIIAIKKNCNENGFRGKDLGSNPHSNGEDFSRSIIDFLEKIFTITIIMIVIKKIKNIRIVTIRIIYTY